ncbi:MAG: hypothetical protein LBQ61_05805 [Spirochaetales bacterium]|jgi:hypothetical protein|nr:hypothetical protein [Spirochaetales bacterium]
MEQAKHFIFHLTRRNGLPLILHPFNDEAFLQEWGDRLQKGEALVLLGCYGAEPRVDSLVFFRNEVYQHIEQHVERWMQEKRFIPRFLFSAGVFLLAYFFAAIVIRDPLPLLDEILIAGGAAAGAYFLLGRQIKSSQAAVARRICLRDAADKIVFNYSPLLHRLEDLLQENEQLAPAELFKRLLAGDGVLESWGEPGEEEARQLGDLLGYLNKRFKTRGGEKLEKILAARKKTLPRGPAGRIYRTDMPLFSLYAKLKRRAFLRN